MRDTAVTAKYIAAFKNSLETKELQSALEELQTVIHDICGHDKVWAILQSPLTSASEKLALVQPRLSNCKHNNVKNFLHLLISKSRINLLDAFTPLIEDAICDAKSIKKANINTAGQISDSAKQA
ncbi:MAG: F0F1 ATP synthase subunit delta, partial [bacterium]|nr:F0F1 ATP synthase subunit delta [bacterium]